MNGRNLMTPTKFPVWIYIVLALQMLVALAFSGFLLILGNAYNSENLLSLGSIIVLMVILFPPPLCWWQSRSQWQAERYTVARVLAFGPVVAFCALNVVLALVLAR
jgi:hypothetical protein